MHLLPLLKSYPKCYALWSHRLWVLSQSDVYLALPKAQKMWKEELGLVGMMLGRDERNFHGWQYRRFVVEAMQKGLTSKGESFVQQEFEYTTAIIKGNMSNFSAWHGRTKLAGKVLRERGANIQERMDFLEDGGSSPDGLIGLIKAKITIRNKPPQESHNHQTGRSVSLVLSSVAHTFERILAPVKWPYR